MCILIAYLNHILAIVSGFSSALYNPFNQHVHPALWAIRAVPWQSDTQTRFALWTELHSATESLLFRFTETIYRWHFEGTIDVFSLVFLGILISYCNFCCQARQQSFLIMDFENPKFQPRLNKSLPCMSNRLAGSRLDVGLMAYWQPYARDRTLRWQCVFLLRDSNLLSSQYQHDKSCRFASVTEGESVLLSLSMRRRNQRSGLTVTWEAF